MHERVAGLHPQQILGDDHVPRRRHGEEFRESLHDSDNNGLKQIHALGLLVLYGFVFLLLFGIAIHANLNLGVNSVPGLANDSVDHKDKTYEAHHRSHLDTPRAEDVRIESRLRRGASTHKNKPDNDNGKADTQQDEIGTAQG